MPNQPQNQAQPKYNIPAIQSKIVMEKLVEIEILKAEMEQLRQVLLNERQKNESVVADLNKRLGIASEALQQAGG